MFGKVRLITMNLNNYEIRRYETLKILRRSNFYTFFIKVDFNWFVNRNLKKG